MIKTLKILSNIKYLNAKKNINNKKYIFQFLPISFESFSKEKNFYYNEQKLKTSYIIDILHNLILKYYLKKENKFNLSSTILKEKYGYLYNYYIKYLVDKKILILIAKHQKGKNARIYSINESILRSDIIRYYNSDKVLLKKYKSKIFNIDDSVENNLIDIDIKDKLIDDLFKVKIEFERSIFYLDTLRNDDIDIYNRNKYSVECINDTHIFYHFDKYGRMHTNFTILKSFIRKNCLLIDDEETYECDISNSQPLFLAKLINDSKSKWVDEKELDLFKYLTLNGKYYNYIMDFSGLDRAKSKELTYKVLFGRNMYNSKSDKIFKELFPTIHNFIKLYKKEFGDYKILSYDLQKSESNFIFNKVVREIMTLLPDISIITVHDSIVFPRKYKDVVKLIFEKKIEEEFCFY